MHKLLICGAGKIGAIIAAMLADTGDYQVFLADKNLENINPELKRHQYPKLSIHEFDITNPDASKKFINKNTITTLISCLPYSLTVQVAKLAKSTNCHYFDLTEDVNAANEIKKLAKDANQAFVPQCGLAPGFINIVANELLQKFTSPAEAKLRCGALPESTSNALQYALNWSTEGLINEYGNSCQAIVNGKITQLKPLADREEIQIDGLNYEAFNTSGGIGTLIDTFKEKIENLNYKTIRYPGHCAKMKFLMEGLNLNEDRETLKRILENAIPYTIQDVVIVYVSTKGKLDQKLFSETFVKKYYPTTLAKIKCSAIQATTACGACTVIDIVLSNEKKYHGLIPHANFSLNQIYKNRFGKFFK